MQVLMSKIPCIKCGGLVEILEMWQERSICCTQCGQVYPQPYWEIWVAVWRLELEKSDVSKVSPV